MQPVSSAFFAGHSLVVGQSLLGQVLLINGVSAVITEVEVYRGTDDAASHAFRRSPRSALMFGPPGKLYVYLTYGMHYILNITTEPDGVPGAILIRAIRIGQQVISGPGRVSKKLGVDRRFNGIDVDTNTPVQLLKTSVKPAFIATPRIGIRHATDKYWRFVCV